MSSSYGIPRTNIIRVEEPDSSSRLGMGMIKEKSGVDSNTVIKKEIDKGQFIIEFEGGHKGISMDELEEAGYGRRSNCRRCKLKVPRQADVACGNWDVIGDKTGKATFIEICSEKGAALLTKAVATKKPLCKKLN